MSIFKKLFWFNLPLFGNTAKVTCVVVVRSSLNQQKIWEFHDFKVVFWIARVWLWRRYFFAPRISWHQPWAYYSIFPSSIDSKSPVWTCRKIKRSFDRMRPTLWTGLLKWCVLVITDTKYFDYSIKIFLKLFFITHTSVNRYNGRWKRWKYIFKTTEYLERIWLFCADLILIFCSVGAPSLAKSQRISWHQPWPYYSKLLFSFASRPTLWTCRKKIGLLIWCVLAKIGFFRATHRLSSESPWRYSRNNSIPQHTKQSWINFLQLSWRRKKTSPDGYCTILRTGRNPLWSSKTLFSDGRNLKTSREVFVLLLRLSRFAALFHHEPHSCWQM